MSVCLPGRRRVGIRRERMINSEWSQADATGGLHGRDDAPSCPFSQGTRPAGRQPEDGPVRIDTAIDRGQGRCSSRASRLSTDARARSAKAASRWVCARCESPSPSYQTASRKCASAAWS